MLLLKHSIGKMPGFHRVKFSFKAIEIFTCAPFLPNIKQADESTLLT